MAERLIQTVPSPKVGTFCKLYYESGNQEYRVALYKDGIHYHPADYFTDDKDDALATAEDMVKRNSAPEPDKM